MWKRHRFFFTLMVNFLISLDVTIFVLVFHRVLASCTSRATFMNGLNCMNWAFLWLPSMNQILGGVLCVGRALLLGAIPNHWAAGHGTRFRGVHPVRVLPPGIGRLWLCRNCWRSFLSHSILRRFFVRSGNWFRHSSHTFGSSYSHSCKFRRAFSCAGKLRRLCSTYALRSVICLPICFLYRLTKSRFQLLASLFYYVEFPLVCVQLSLVLTQTNMIIWFEHTLLHPYSTSLNNVIALILAWTLSAS